MALVTLAPSPVGGRPRRDGGRDTPRRQADAAAGTVAPGVEVLLSDSLHLVRGKRVGLITNQTGRDRRGRSTIDLLFHAPGVRLVALFAPEHGLRGTSPGGASIGEDIDRPTGLPIHSLYGRTLVPTPAMLRDVDVLVYDVQDVGARMYTYPWTMALSAAAARKPFVVLDRPDLIRGDRVEGGLLDPRFRSFTGRFPIALRYGLTPGELLRYLVATAQVDATVTVVPMRRWRRAMWSDETGLPWVNPSPNIRDLDAATLYPGIAFFEATNVSEGRGTPTPFRLVGAPWLRDAGVIARELNALALPGIQFDSTTRRIGPGEKFGGRRIPMIALRITDRDRLRPVDVAVHVMRAIYRRHPREWRWQGDGIERLAGTTRLRRAVERGGVDALLRRWDVESRAFERAVRPYRLYD